MSKRKKVFWAVGLVLLIYYFFNDWLWSSLNSEVISNDYISELSGTEGLSPLTWIDDQTILTMKINSYSGTYSGMHSINIKSGKSVDLSIENLGYPNIRFLCANASENKIYFTMAWEGKFFETGLINGKGALKEMNTYVDSRTCQPFKSFPNRTDVESKLNENKNERILGWEFVDKAWSSKFGLISFYIARGVPTQGRLVIESASGELKIFNLNNKVFSSGRPWGQIQFENENSIFVHRYQSDFSPNGWSLPFWKIDLNENTGTQIEPSYVKPGPWVEATGFFKELSCFSCGCDCYRLSKLYLSERLKLLLINGAVVPSGYRGIYSFSQDKPRMTLRGSYRNVLFQSNGCIAAVEKTIEETGSSKSTGIKIVDFCEKSLN